MKQRLLSVLLLLAMLVTMIPVAASAEEVNTNTQSTTTEQTSTEELPELYTLYVDRGLVALYTAFSDDGSVDLDNGTWANKVAGGASAILRDTSDSGDYWQKRGMGVGYTMAYTSSDQVKVGLKLPDSYAELENYTVETMAKVYGMTDEDGNRQIATGEKWTKYVSAFRFGIARAMFNNALIYTPAEKSANGNDIYYFFRPEGNGNYPYGTNNGWYVSSSFGIRWHVQPSAFTGSNPANRFTNNDDKGWLRVGDNMNDHTIPVAAVMQFVKTTTAGDTDETTTVKYAVSYNNKKTPIAAGTDFSTMAKEAYYTLTKAQEKELLASQAAASASNYDPEAGTMSLFNALPADVYAVRVYNTELTEAEKAQNRLIDLMYYHGAKPHKLLFEDEDMLLLMVGKASEMTITEDATKKAANKAILEDTIPGLAAQAKILDSYAAKDALVAFFTTADKTTVNLVNGEWTDIVAGHKATFKGQWEMRENGSFGFDAWAGYMKGGVYTPGKTDFVGDTTQYFLNKNALEFDINMLPDEDFTVEYVATYRPLLIADADKTAESGKLVYYEEDGKPLSAYDYAVRLGVETQVETKGKTYVVPQSTSGAASDMFGFFGNYTQIVDGYGGWGGTSATRGTVYWTIGLAAFGNPMNYFFVGGGWATTDGAKAGLAKKNDPYHITGGNTFNTYGVSVDETVKGGDTEALFTIYRDAVKYADNSANINSTANNAAANVVDVDGIWTYYVGSDNQKYYLSNKVYYNVETGEVKADDITVGSVKYEDWGTAYYDCDYTELEGALYGKTRHGFWLSAGTPTDFLAVRVYNRALTQAEKNINALVDILLYYGVEIDENLSKLLEDEKFVSELVYTLNNFAGAQIVTDASKRDAIAEDIKAAVKTLQSSIERDRKNDYASLYVTEGENGAKLVGLFTTFDGNYSVDFATGTWKNQVAGGKDATLRSNSLTKYWQRYDMGIGYAMTQTQFINKGTSYPNGQGDGKNVGVSLSEDYDTDNFTVEAFAKVVGLTNEDGTPYIAPAEGSIYNTYVSAFRFGLAGGFFFAGLRGNYVVYKKVTDPDTGKQVDYVDPETGEKVVEKIYDYYKVPTANIPEGHSYAWGLSSSLSIRWYVQNVGFKNAVPAAPAEYFDSISNGQENGWLLTRGDHSLSDTDHTVPTAGVMQFTKTTTPGADRASTVIKYAVSYNNGGKLTYNGATEVSSTVTGAEYDSIAAETRTATNEYAGGFSLFNGVPGVIYAIRVYDGVLTAAEKTQNRLVDLMYYHGVDIVETLKDPEIMQMAASIAGSIAISSDASKTAANKHTLEASIASAAIKIEMLEAYAGRENLTAFFTTEDAGTVNLAAGTWADIISGATATLEGKTNWVLRDDGTVGFDAWAGYMSKGVYTKGKTGFTGDTTAYMGNKYGLNIGLDNIPTEDFTVEYLALYRPLLIADADKSKEAGELVYYTEAGLPVGIFDYALAKGYDASNASKTLYIPQSAFGKAGDSFGWFNNHTQQIDGFGGWGTAPRGSVYWTVGHAEGLGTNQRFLGTGWATATANATAYGLAKTTDAFRVTGGKAFNTYGVTVDESVVEGETEALFTIYRDGVFYADNSAAITSTANQEKADVCQNAFYYRMGDDDRMYYSVTKTVDGVSQTTWYDDLTGAVKPEGVVIPSSNTAEEWGDVYYGDDYKAVKEEISATAGFWLSAGIPTDFIAVRVYDRVLTDSEKLHNRLIDLLYYYDVELPEEIKNDATLMHEVAIAASSISLSRDALAKAVAKLELEDVVKHVLASSASYELYVQDGLTAQFSALNAGEMHASIANGVWHNRVVGSKNATFGNLTNWKRNANGSVGFNLFGGMIDDNGVYTLASNYNNYNVAGTRLNLGKELIPEGNYTVEYVAKHKPVYVANKLGDPYVKDGVIAETFNYNTVNYESNGQDVTVNNTPNSGVGTAVFAIGYLQAFTTNRDGMHTNTNKRGDLAWTVSSSSDWYRAQASRKLLATLAPVKDTLAVNGSVHSYAITRVKEATLADPYKGTYTFLRDSVAHSIYNIDGTLDPVLNYQKADFTKPDAVYTEPNKDGVQTEKTAFYLADGTPADFYAVRVYNRALTVEELAQNHFADIVLYYGLTFDKALLAKPEIIKACAIAFVDAEISDDASVKTANKAAYQALLDATVAAEANNTSSVYDELYIQNGLVGLFTAFEGDHSVDIFNGTWKNKATESGYADATLRLGARYWRRNTFGVGYSMNAAEWTADGKEVGISLDDKYEELSEFTVETFATLVGLTDKNGDRIIAESGKVVDGITLKKSYYVNGRSGFRFGMLASLGFASLSTSGGESLLYRWAISNIGFPGGTWKEGTENADAKLHYQGYNIGNDAGTSDTGWRTRGDGYEPLPGLMQVTRVPGEVNGEKNVSYSIAYDNKAPLMSTTMSLADYNKYAAYTNDGYAEGEGYRFTLFNTVPADVYAIRVYNRALTDEEKLHNSFVDKAAWYGLDVSEFSTLDATVQKNILNIFADVDYTRDAATVQAIYDFNVSTETAEEMAEKTILFKEIAPILAGANGYRAYFELNKTAYDLFVANGYTVTYGALVAPAGTKVELGTEGVRDIVVGGNNGSYIFKELAGAGGHLYTAAVTADEATYFGVDMVVRGYIKVEKAGEDTIVYYDDASLNGETNVSILDATDYFVNYYDGDITTQYKYMNSAALRGILDACGVNSRASLEDDLTIWVDASNEGEQNGETPATAYTSMEDAFAAAKAHLGKTGRKTVTIRVAEGTYYVTEELKLTAEDVKLLDAYSFEVIGSGDTTIFTSEIEIDKSDVLFDDEQYLEYVQLPQNEDGSYPAFRAVYGDGKLLDVARRGTSEETWDIADFWIIDEDGNKLTPVRGFDTNFDEVIDEKDALNSDWILSDTDKLIAKYAVYKLPAEMFDTSYLDYYGGTELHISQLWESNIAHIDYVEEDPDDSDYVLAYVAYGEMPFVYTNAKMKGNICWLENSVELAYETGAHYYNQENGRLYWSSSPDNESGFYSVDKLTYASLSSMFVFDGVENVAVRNLAITGLDTDYILPNATTDMTQSGAITLRFNELIVTNQAAIDKAIANGADPVAPKYAWKTQGIGYQSEGAIAGRNVDGLTVEAIKVYDTLSGGVIINNVLENFVVDSSSFTNLGASAIQLGGTNTNYVKNGLVQNNYVNTIGTVYKACAGILISDAANLRVIGNTVVNTPWSAFSLGNSFTTVQSTLDQIIGGGDFGLFNVEFAYNYARNFMTSQHDGGAFYMNGRTLVPDSDHDGRYNFMHHNYVVMDDETGLTGSGEYSTANKDRVVYCYYFETGSSNWYVSENVLLNQVNANYPNAVFYGMYFQAYRDCQARDMTAENNYYLNYPTLKRVFTSSGNSQNPQAVFNQSASDFLYTSIENLAKDTATEDSFNNGSTKASLAGAGATVAGIFAAAGSTLSTEDKTAYLTYTAGGTTVDLTADVEAPARVLGTDGELADLSFFADRLALKTVTYDDGNGTVLSVKGLVGAPLNVPASFTKEGVSCVFTVNGEVIDLASYVIPNEDITVEVTVNPDMREVTIRGGEEEVKFLVAIGDKILLPESLKKEGSDITVSYNDAIISLDSFKMPAEDIELRVTYSPQKHIVNFVDDEGKTAFFAAESGTPVRVDLDIFSKPYMHPVFYMGDWDNNPEIINMEGYQVPADDVLIKVTYEWNTYTIHFKSDITYGNMTTTLDNGTAEITFGQAITLPEKLENTAPYEYEGYYYYYTGEWLGLVPGETILSEIHIPEDPEEEIVFYTVWEIGEPPAPEFALGDINEDGIIDATDINLLTQVFKNKVVDPTQIKGETDINADGIVDATDINRLTAIFKGVVAS